MLGKPFKILNVKTKEVEEIVREMFTFELSIENYLTIAYDLFKSEYYMFGAAGIILLQRNKRRFKDKALCEKALGSIAQFFDIIDNWPHTDSLCLKVIHPMLEKHPSLYIVVQTWGRQRDNIWPRRASIVSFTKIVRNASTIDEWLTFITPYLSETHPMIVKACGWFLKDCYNQFPEQIKIFLFNNAGRMDRLVLRTAIEKMPPAERKNFLDQTR